MAFKLLFKTDSTPDSPVIGASRDVGENVFLEQLPNDYRVYLFYYPGAMPDLKLEDRLRSLGGLSGHNLFVNIGRLDDPKHSKIVRSFDIRSYPVIVVTALASLASPTEHNVSAYARLDGRNLLRSADHTLDCVQQLFSLFLQGRVSDAIAQAKWSQRMQLVAVLTQFFTTSLKTLGSFIDTRDISISLAEGKFELKRAGA